MGGDVPNVGQKLDQEQAQVGERPVRYEEYGPGSDATAARLTFDPIADLGLVLLHLDQPAGPKEITCRRVDNDHRR